jgi:ATP-dependent Clp protease adapter protein ClpS
VIVSRSGAIIDDDTEFEEITKIAKENEEKYRTSDEYKSITVIDDNTLPNYIRSSLGKYYRGLEPEDVKLAAIEYAEDAEKEGAVADAKPKKAKKAKKVKTTKKPKEAKVVEPATEAANAAAVEAEFEEEPF